MDILKTTELWFVLVVNPDGYEFTFTDERLWRKNLHDNDGNAEITNVDGVDLQSKLPGALELRRGRLLIGLPRARRTGGPDEASEPETDADQGPG